MSYAKLSSFSRGFARYRWYRGPDHLLLAEVRTWRVDYRRIFLRDIESVIVYSSRRDIVRAFCWFIPGTLVAWPFFQFGASSAGWLFLLAGIALALLELLLGPFGHAAIRTRTSQLPYPLANRWSKNVRVAKEIRTLVEQVQGPAIAVSGPVDLNLRRERAAALAGPAEPKIAPRPWCRTLWAATAGLALSGLWAIWEVAQFPSWPLGVPWTRTAADSLVGIGAFALTVVAAVLVFRYRCLPGVRGLALAYAILGPVGGLAVFMAMLMSPHGVSVMAPFASSAARQTMFVFSAGRALLALVGAGWFLRLDGHFAAAPEPLATDDAPLAPEAANS